MAKIRKKKEINDQMMNEITRKIKETVENTEKRDAAKVDN